MLGRTCSNARHMGIGDLDHAIAGYRGVGVGRWANVKGMHDEHWAAQRK
jgi:hypothetical protein